MFDEANTVECLKPPSDVYGSLEEYLGMLLNKLFDLYPALWAQQNQRAIVFGVKGDG